MAFAEGVSAFADPKTIRTNNPANTKTLDNMPTLLVEVGEK
jgi:hypothetical protein